MDAEFLRGVDTAPGPSGWRPRKAGGRRSVGRWGDGAEKYGTWFERGKFQSRQAEMSLEVVAERTIITRETENDGSAEAGSGQVSPVISPRAAGRVGSGT